MIDHTSIFHPDTALQSATIYQHSLEQCDPLHLVFSINACSIPGNCGPCINPLPLFWFICMLRTAPKAATQCLSMINQCASLSLSLITFVSPPALLMTEAQGAGEQALLFREADWNINAQLIYTADLLITPPLC